MGRRTFLRNSLPTAGGVLLGGSAISRFLKDGKMEGPPNMSGQRENVLALMSAGSRQGNTGPLTDALFPFCRM